MTRPHPSFTPVRLLAGVLIVASLLCAATAAAAAEPGEGDALAPGWQARAHPLFMERTRLDASRTSWYVPATLPPGRYAVVERIGDKAEVIDSVRFRAPGTGFTDIHLLLPAVYSNVEAVPVSDLPAKTPTTAKP